MIVPPGIAAMPRFELLDGLSPLAPLRRFSAALGGGPRLLVKRDDALPFAFGGNKVRKLALVAARAQADGADTLITAGAVQSNHARVTAAAAAKLGMRAVLVVNGRPSSRPAANALLDAMLGAEPEHALTVDERSIDEIRPQSPGRVLERIVVHEAQAVGERAGVEHFPD